MFLIKNYFHYNKTNFIIYVIKKKYYIYFLIFIYLIFFFKVKILMKFLKFIL